MSRAITIASYPAPPQGFILLGPRGAAPALLWQASAQRTLCACAAWCTPHPVLTLHQPWPRACESCPDCGHLLCRQPAEQCRPVLGGGVKGGRRDLHTWARKAVLFQEGLAAEIGSLQAGLRVADRRRRAGYLSTRMNSRPPPFHCRILRRRSPGRKRQRALLQPGSAWWAWKPLWLQRGHARWAWQPLWLQRGRATACGTWALRAAAQTPDKSSAS